MGRTLRRCVVGRRPPNGDGQGEKLDAVEATNADLGLDKYIAKDVSYQE